MSDKHAPQRFRKKPVEIDAIQWDGTPGHASTIIDWMLSHGGTARWRGPVAGDPNCVDAGGHHVWRYCPSCTYVDEPLSLAIDTLEGTMHAKSGDWIIRGIQGEFYPCKPDIFADTYDLVQ